MALNLLLLSRSLASQEVVTFVSPCRRFAKWVEGDSHLSDDEVYAFDHEPLPPPAFDETEEDEIDFRLRSL